MSAKDFFDFLTDFKNNLERPSPTKLKDTISEADELIRLLKERGFGDRDRLFRKLAEEFGEYAEAIEFNNGSTRKVVKLKGKDPQKMLKEEISDVVLVGLALARLDGLKIADVLQNIINKLSKREQEHQTSKK